MGLHLLVNSTACSKPKCCGSRTGPESLTQNLGTRGWEETLRVLKPPVLDGLAVPVPMPRPCHVVAASAPRRQQLPLSSEALLIFVWR